MLFKSYSLLLDVYWSNIVGCIGLITRFQLNSLKLRQWRSHSRAHSFFITILHKGCLVHLRGWSSIENWRHVDSFSRRLWNVTFSLGVSWTFDHFVHRALCGVHMWWIAQGLACFFLRIQSWCYIRYFHLRVEALVGKSCVFNHRFSFLIVVNNWNILPLWVSSSLLYIT